MDYVLEQDGSILEINAFTPHFVDTTGVYRTVGWLTHADTTASDIANAGLIPIIEGDADVGSIYTSAPTSALVKGDGCYNRVYTAEDLPLDQMQMSVCNSIAATCTTLLSSYTPSFGPLAGKTLQCRNNQDRTNWLTSQAAYTAAIATGQGDVAGAVFRCADNTTITTTFSEGEQTLLGMAARGASVYANSWRLKDAATATADTTSLKALDLTAGWPA